MFYTDNELNDILNNKELIILQLNNNCVLEFTKDFIINCNITKFRFILKNLNENKNNITSLNEILKINEKYKNKEKFEKLIIDYIIKRSGNR